MLQWWCMFISLNKDLDSMISHLFSKTWKKYHRVQNLRIWRRKQMVCLFCPCLELNNSLVSHSDGCTQRKFAHGSTGAECHQKYLWSLCFLPVVLRRNAFNFIPINSHEHSIFSQSQQNTSLSLWDDWFNVRLNGKLCGSPGWPYIFCD